jgi:hypothetical protein
MRAQASSSAARGWNDSQLASIRYCLTNVVPTPRIPVHAVGTDPTAGSPLPDGRRLHLNVVGYSQVMSNVEGVD